MRSILLMKRLFSIAMDQHLCVWLTNLETQSQFLENYNESKVVNVIFMTTICYTQVPRDFLGTFVSFTNSNI